LSRGKCGKEGTLFWLDNRVMDETLKKKAIKVATRAQNIKDNTPIALAKEFINVEEKVDNLADTVHEMAEKMTEPEEKPEVQRVQLEGISLVTIKGDKGDKGDIGERGEKGDNGVDGQNGKDGKDGKNGRDGIDGVDGKNGVDGKDGKDGKDGSPDTGEEIVSKINELPTDNEDYKIDAKHIKNLPKQDIIRGGGGTRYLEQLVDVNLDGLTKDAQGKYELGSGGGVSDHGALTGLLDDDHTQYHTDARGDARYPLLTSLGANNGIATLDSSGKVPSSQLPSYVDDVLEYANLASFPVTGTTSIIYVALDTNKTYRWSGSSYVEISPSEVTSVAGKTGAVTLVKADVGLSNVDNTSDLNKPISTATQTALDGKANTSHTHTASNVTDFNEAAQDAVGTILTDSTEIDFTYNDATPSITASIVAGSIDETKLDASVNASLDLADTASQPGHTHTIANVTGLQTALDNKLDDSQASAFGLSLLDDADAATARTTLGLGTLATQSGTFSGTSSGTNTGDVTLAGAPNYLTIAGQVITRALIDLANHVTGKLPFANIADVATGTVMYRKTAGTGSMEAQTLATLKTDLGLTGTNSGDQTITLTSDVTGSGTGSFATTITNNAVSLAKMADVATGTVFYRKTAGTGDPEVQTLATLKTDLGLTGTNSGDQTSIVGITGTKAQFDTAVTDGNFMYTGDEAATVATINGKVSAGTNVTVTGSGTTASPYVINSSGGGGGSYTFSNGLNEVAGVVTLGSSLSQTTTISQATNTFEISESSSQGLFLSASGVNALKGEGVEITGGTVATFGSPVEVRMFTPAINSATATAGQALVLQDAATGQVEFQTVPTIGLMTAMSSGVIMS